MKKQVAVIGSYNVGLFLKGTTLPSPGETVIGDQFYEGGGGKGSNQAIAAAMLGADVRFVGRIGDDKYGEDALSLYNRKGISTETIIIDKEHHTGIGAILIDQQGHNLISVVPGANFHLTKKDIDRCLPFLKNASIVGFQLENTFEIVDYAVSKFYEMDIPVLLDPAPARALPDAFYSRLSYIKPNEHEATILSGIEVTDVESAKSAGRWFRKQGVETAIITLGSIGAVLVDPHQERFFSGIPVNAIDTTGAGDCFGGALMSAIARGIDIAEAIVFANQAAAICVTRLSVVEALPTLKEVQDAMCKTRVDNGPSVTPSCLSD